jgi:micrococcal nuclease
VDGGRKFLAGPLAVAVAGVLWAACAHQPRGPGPPGPVGFGSYQVTRVTDGDTIHVQLGSRDERVRLIGVNTPEVPWYGGRGECFGVEAGLYTRGRLTGRTVRLSIDRDLRDRYGRLLAYAYVGSELFNLTLVQLGYATADPVRPDVRFAHAFDRAEGMARARKAGLWRTCPTEP